MSFELFDDAYKSRVTRKDSTMPDARKTYSKNPLENFTTPLSTSPPAQPGYQELAGDSSTMRLNRVLEWIKFVSNGRTSYDPAKALEMEELAAEVASACPHLAMPYVQWQRWVQELSAALKTKAAYSRTRSLALSLNQPANRATAELLDALENTGGHYA
jgi:hypothetical protein